MAKTIVHKFFVKFVCVLGGFKNRLKITFKFSLWIHRGVEAGRHLWRSSGSASLLKQSPGPCPEGFQVCPVRETPRPLLATCASAWSPSQYKSVSCHSEGTYCISFCACGILSLSGHHWKHFGSTCFLSSLQVFTLIVDVLVPIKTISKRVGFFEGK